MKKDSLSELLERLHAELQSAENVDKKAKTLLKTLSRDIQTILKNKTPSKVAVLGKRLEESTELFEASHPTLAVRMQNVCNALSNLGI